MPIMKRLKGLDWPALVAELVLIFVGITAALWFDNVNREREERHRELAVLVQLRAALESDTADLNFNLRSSGRTLQSIDTVLAFLSRRAPYDSSLAEHFSQAAVATNFVPNSAAYEYLKSLGLGTVSSDSLRFGITHYYEVQVQVLTRVEELFVNGNWTNALMPQMMEKFAYRFLFEPAVPHDYDSLTRDTRYRTVLTTTKEILEWKDQISRQTLGKAEALLESISPRPSGR